MAKKQKKLKVSKKTGAKKNHHNMMFLVLTVVLGVMFFPMALLLFVGMLPTFAAGLALVARKRSRIVTIGAMNLVGCMFYLLELWEGGGSFSLSLDILFNPVSIIVMYSAAGAGYLMEWSVTGLVASLLYGRGKARKVEIEKRQEELVRRWSRSVTGEIPLDEDGFPINE